MANILLIFLSLKIYRDTVSMKVEKSKKIKEKDVRSTTSKQFRIKKSGKKRKSGTDKRRRGKMEEKKKD